MRLLVCLLLIALPHPVRAQQQQAISPSDITIVGDSIPAALTGKSGDAARGRVIVLDRAIGNCLICHQAPVATEPFQGNIGPSLQGVGARLTEAQIRLRVVDQSRINSATLMPPFYRIDDLTRVAERFRGKPVLSAAQVEDVIAFLVSLKD